MIIKKTYKIVLLGPESTGKTYLAKRLAHFYNTTWLPEYGRYYLQKLARPYTYEDVVNIAKMQYLREKKYINLANEKFFVDTDLINIEVWFEIVFHKKPSWLSSKMKEIFADLYLLCKPDLPWIPDSVRENGGQMRQKLFDIYEQKLIDFGLDYKIIDGFGNKRFKNCVNYIDVNLKKSKI